MITFRPDGLSFISTTKSGPAMVVKPTSVQVVQLELATGVPQAPPLSNVAVPVERLY